MAYELSATGKEMGSHLYTFYLPDQVEQSLEYRIPNTGALQSCVLCGYLISPIRIINLSITDAIDAPQAFSISV